MRKPTITVANGVMSIATPDLSEVTPEISSTGKTEQIYYSYGKTGFQLPDGRDVKFQLRVYADIKAPAQTLTTKPAVAHVPVQTTSVAPAPVATAPVAPTKEDKPAEAVELVGLGAIEF